MQTMYAQGSLEMRGTAKPPPLTESMEVDSGLTFTDLKIFAANPPYLFGPDLSISKADGQVPCEPEYSDLLKELFAHGPTEEEATVDANNGDYLKVDCGSQPLAELKAGEINVVFSTDDGNECAYVGDQQKAEIKASPAAVEEEPAMVRVTQEPQLLSQSDIPKPWKGRQSSRSSSSDASSTHGSTSLCHDPESDLDVKVDYMKRALEFYDKDIKANSSNGKIQVHQVVHFLLLANNSPVIGVDLAGILEFCDANGKPTKNGRDHFKAMDTKTMGLVWQKVKGNRNANFDTFARAMRVCRERSKDFFEYLDSGRGSKKKIYKLGGNSHLQLRDMERKLSSICASVEK